MRSKEVDGAINTIREFRKTGYCTLLLKCDNNRIRANTRIEISIETVLSYIEELEKENKYLRDENNIYKNETVSKRKIRHKIKELEDEKEKYVGCKGLEFSRTGVINSQIKVLKSIIGE